MLILSLVPAAYAAVAAIAYHRWRLRGVAALGAAVIAIDLIQGTASWLRPHDHPWLYRDLDWPCHATGLLLPVSILGLALMLVLHGTRGWITGLAGRVTVAATTGALLAFPLLFVILWWGVQVLGCDTL